MSKETELEPCPFCRVVPKLEIEADGGDYDCGIAPWEYASISALHKETCPLYMSDECCENSGSIQIVDLSGSNVQDFITAWNTRVADDKTPSTVHNDACDAQGGHKEELEALDCIVTAYCMSLGLNPPTPEEGSQTYEQAKLIRKALGGE